MSFILARRAVTPQRCVRAFSSTTVRSTAKVTIVGSLVDTPELQATSTGRDILKYAVASSSGPASKRTTSFFRVTSFEGEGPRRDYFQSLQKGTLVMVDGEISISTYDDSEGKKRDSLNIVQRSLEVLRKPTQGSSD